MARSRTGRRSPFPDRITSVGCNPPRNRTDVEVGRQKRAAQLLGKDVGVRTIDRRRESYSVSDWFLTLAGQCSASYLSEILSIKLYDGTVTGFEEVLPGAD